MSRVFLFVADKGGRPKVARYSPRVCDHWPSRLGQATCGSCHGTGYSVEPWVSSPNTDRWWLVECENAEAGRKSIAMFVDFNSHLPWKLPRQFGPGRILASGGRSAP
jgi:hypothetical protein